MYLLCYLFETNCFVHSFRAKDYIVLTRYTKALSLFLMILTQNYTKLPLHTPLYFSKYLEQLGNRFAS